MCARAWWDQPIDWIRSIRPSVRSSKGQSGVLQAIGHSVTRSMTAQPPGFCPSALWVATHSQQVASLVGVLPLCRGAVGIFYSFIWQDSYRKGDIMLVGAWLNRWTTKWRTWMVTELLSPQIMCMDREPHHGVTSALFLIQWVVLWRMRPLHQLMTRYGC